MLGGTFSEGHGEAEVGQTRWKKFSTWSIDLKEGLVTKKVIKEYTLFFKCQPKWGFWNSIVLILDGVLAASQESLRPM